MGRLQGKNILVIIPKDYYNEEELNPCLELFRREEPTGLLIASPKLKEAVGLRNGRIMPDVLLVDAVEGVMGDSYVTTSGRGTRQVKGVFHGVVVIGGRGTKKYLWNDRILRIILNDRLRAGAVVAAIGLGVPSLGVAEVIDSAEVSAPDDAEGLTAIEKANASTVEAELTICGQIITARSAVAAKEFAEAVVEAVRRTDIRK
jgi:protease I